MPLPQQSCIIPEDTCCNTVFDIAQFVLNTVYDGIIGCMPFDCNGQAMPLRRYVTLGQGDDGIADSLTVAFMGANPSTGSFDNNGNLLAVSKYRADYDVRLREAGWPMVSTDGGKLDAPDPVMQMAIARHAYAHGEKMFRVLRNLARGAKTTWLSGYPNPAFCTVNQLRTINPQGGIVGMSAVLTVDLPWGQDGH